MKHPVPGRADLVAPKQQRNWDWRAATNFIAGGAGGALLLFAALGGFEPGVKRAAVLVALGLIACGLTCVWFEIGRPLRAMNVYRHFASSWMTREAVVALAVFASGGLAFLSQWTPLFWLAGAAGLAFLYSQARILAANKGIPAWRHPRSVALMVSTGLTEGAGLLACVSVLSGATATAWHSGGLLALIVVRGLVWKGYLAALAEGGAPEAALKALHGIAGRMSLAGQLLPGIAVILALLGLPGSSVCLLLAGILVVATGWFLKFTLVRRAAYTQGFALQRLPVRGGGMPGPATKPGWKTIAGAKAG